MDLRQSYVKSLYLIHFGFIVSYIALFDLISINILPYFICCIFLQLYISLSYLLSTTYNLLTNKLQLFYAFL
jgi:hypothetical protein